MVDVSQATAWDLKPNRENTNKIFNVLCNVQPVEHPWSWDWYARQIDVTTWSKDQFWFEKCKWLRKCKLYEYECYWDHVELVVPEDVTEEWDERASSKKRRNEKLWSNANFTDVILFQWYRIYMRKNSVSLNPYWNSSRTYNWKTYVDSWWDNDADTCDEWDRPSNVLEDMSIDKTITTARYDKNRVSTYNTADRIRIYIQPVDTKWCTWDTFDSADESPIILAKEYEAAECNPDHFVMWYGGIWVPTIIKKSIIYMILYSWELYSYIIIWDEWINIWPTDSLYIKDRWIYISWLNKPDQKFNEILTQLDIPLWWYTTPNSSELTQAFLLPEIPDWQVWWYEASEMWLIYSFQNYWEVPYFVAGNKLYSLNWFFARNDNDCEVPTDDELQEVIYRWNFKEADYCDVRDVDYQKKRLFLFDTAIDTAQLWWSWTITWLSRWWARLAYVADNNIYVSWNWSFVWVFTTDLTWWDLVRWPHPTPAWVTDIKTIWSSLIFFWPKAIFATANEETLRAWAFVNGTDNEDWFYSPWSYHNDDWELLLARRWKVLWTLQVQVSYTNSISIAFDPSTGFYVNSHFKELNNEYDKINIDANINYRYVSIYDDNDVWDHYSKLLIYDKHYNCWYRWLITWARVVHVKDNIFLWDWVYVNKWRTWWRRTNDTEWKEIIEIISAYVWEEWLQTPKHIQYVKTAIWDHSYITNDSYWDIDLSYWWKLFRRRNNITATRYPRLLNYKNREDVIEKYEIGEEIYWHWKILSHNLLNEISEYRNYDKFSETIIREMWEEIGFKSRLAMFASIKEPVNAPANVLELCISARHLDNVQFWSFFIWYYVLDPDYEDIENTNIDQSLISDMTKEPWIQINKWEYCDEILAGSACDVSAE